MIELGYKYCELDKIHFPYHSDNSVILARYKGMNARSTAKYINKKIDKHRKSLIRKKMLR